MKCIWQCLFVRNFELDINIEIFKDGIEPIDFQFLLNQILKYHYCFTKKIKNGIYKLNLQIKRCFLY